MACYVYYVPVCSDGPGEDCHIILNRSVCVCVRGWLKSRMSGDRLRGIRYVSIHLQCFPRSDFEVLSKTGETISSAVETNIHIPSRHLVCGLEVLLCVSVFLGKAGLAGGGVIRGTFSERLSLGPTWLFGCGRKLPWPSDSRGLRALVCVPCTLHPNTTLN